GRGLTPKPVVRETEFVAVVVCRRDHIVDDEVRRDRPTCCAKFVRHWVSPKRGLFMLRRHCLRVVFWRDRKRRIVHARSIVFSEPSRSCHGLICFVVSNPFRVQGSDASRSLTSEILDARRIRSASRVPSSGPTTAATPSS